jgi:hypothetical protein
MKFQVTLSLRSSYDDGAGNTGLYTYTIIDKSIEIADSSIWKLLRFNISNPLASQTFTATSLGGSGGSPPAYTTRTVTIAKTGDVTFVDADEKLYVTGTWTAELKLVPSEMPPHTFTTMDYGMLPSKTPDSERITVNAVVHSENTPVPGESFVVEDDDFIVEAKSYAFDMVYTTDQQTDAQFIPFTVFTAEGDLLSRPYDGKYIEVMLKGLIIAARNKGKSQRYVDMSIKKFAIIEVSNYINGDGPLDVWIPRVTTEVPVA